MEKESTFSKSTALIGIILGILGGAGIAITPQNTEFIIIGVAVIIVTIIIFDKFDKLETLEEDITKLNRKINIEKRLNILEKEISEQKGKLTMAIKR